jgi:hypothetical protein
MSIFTVMSTTKAHHKNSSKVKAKMLILRSTYARIVLLTIETPCSQACYRSGPKKPVLPYQTIVPIDTVAETKNHASTATNHSDPDQADVRRVLANAQTHHHAIVAAWPT